MTRLRLFGFCLAVGCISLQANAADSNGEVIGRVVDALTGKGIARARLFVFVNPAFGSSEPAGLVGKGDPPLPPPAPPVQFALVTDDAGNFRIHHLPAASLDISAEGPGYFSDSSGADDFESRKIFAVSGAGDSVSVMLKLTPEAVIAGRATTAQGDSVARITLWARDEDGVARFKTWQNTDGTGEFRFGNLRSGRYYIEVSTLPANSSEQENPAYLHRFLEDSVSVEMAKPIDLVPGQTENLSIILRPAQGHTVQGRNRCDEPVVAIALYLNLSSGVEPIIQAQGDPETRTFTLTNVPPGSYLLKGTCTVDGKTAPRSLEVSVPDSDVRGIEFPADR